jgi:bacterioferritin
MDKATTAIKPSNSAKPTLTDVPELRRRAREHVENGAVTDAYRGDRIAILDLLNQALATELVCVLRYKRHQFMAQGINAETVAAEFAEHAAQEQGHADQLATRIVQLDGEPNFDPQGLATRSHAEYTEGAGLADMIRENLIAERIAIQSYTEMVAFIGNDDPTTKRMLEGILAVEEEHADDLKTLFASFAGPNGGPSAT